MTKIVNFVNLINTWIGNLAKYLLYLMLFVIFWEIVARYFFDSPTNWSNELVSYLFGSWIFLAGGYTLLKDRHVRMDTLYKKVSSQTLCLVFDSVAFGVTFSFAAFLFWYGGKVALESIRIQEMSWSAWDVPLYPYKSMIPFGSLLIMIQAAARYIEDVQRHLGRKKKSSEAT